jgi:predicted nuclease of restriction endonuclease-like RecB superfamily
VLTADLVRTRKKGSELFVSELSDKLRPRALELAQDYLALAEAHVGASRAELEEAWEGVKVAASERKLALGLCKLVEDRVQFDVQSELDPRVLRGEIFTAVARERQQLADHQVFDRSTFLAQQAAQRGLTPEQLERVLYADLRAAQVLTGFLGVSPEHLVQHYDLAQKQAVFLRAVAIVAEVRCRDPYAYRILFRKLKFFRLMHRIEPRATGYLISIDGPFSLFAASTKYGLELAMALPALLSCDDYDIRAQLRWGKEREPLTFKLQGKGRSALPGEPAVPDEVATFLSRFRGLVSEWEAELSSDILEVRGVGLCVPDIRFVSRETGEVAYLEVLGYWSREAVWKRVELAEKGLKERVIFAASSKLRVSEEVIDENVPAQLYMHKGTLSPREVLRRLSDGPLNH